MRSFIKENSLLLKVTIGIIIITSLIYYFNLDRREGPDSVKVIDQNRISNKWSPVLYMGKQDVDSLVFNMDGTIMDLLKNKMDKSIEDNKERAENIAKLPTNHSIKFLQLNKKIVLKEEPKIPIEIEAVVVVGEYGKDIKVVTNFDMATRSSYDEKGPYKWVETNKGYGFDSDGNAITVKVEGHVVYDDGKTAPSQKLEFTYKLDK